MGNAMLLLWLMPSIGDHSYTTRWMACGVCRREYLWMFQLLQDDAGMELCDLTCSHCNSEDPCSNLSLRTCHVASMRI